MFGMPFYFKNQHVSEALIDTTVHGGVICSTKRASNNTPLD